MAGAWHGRGALGVSGQIFSAPAEKESHGIDDLS